MQNASGLPESFDGRFASLRSRLTVLSILRGFGLISLVFAIGVGTGVLLEISGPPHPQIRWVLWGILLFALTMTLTAGLILPVLRRPKNSELAALVEFRHPNLNESLISAAQFQDPGGNLRHQGSALMREHVQRETAEQLQDLELAEAARSTNAVRLAVTGIAACVCVVLPVIVSPANYSVALNQFLVPWGNYDSPGDLVFEVAGGDRVAARHSDVAVQAKIRWQSATKELPETVRLTWESQQGDSGSQDMEWNSAGTILQGTIPRVRESLDFHIEAQGAYSRRYHVEVVDPPQIAQSFVDIQPPGYSQLSPSRVELAGQELVAFERSQLRFSMLFNKPVESCKFVWAPRLNEDGGEPSENYTEVQSTVNEFDSIHLSPDKLSGTFVLLAESTGTFRFELLDEHGLANDDDSPRALSIIADAPPQLTVVGINEEAEAHPDDLLHIQATADDDTGISALNLVGQTSDGRNFDIAAPPDRLGNKVAVHEFVIDPIELKIEAGLNLELRVRAVDERPIPGPQETWSAPSRVKITRDAAPQASLASHNFQQQVLQTLQQIRSSLALNHGHITRLKTEVGQQWPNEVIQDVVEFADLRQEQIELAQRLERLSQQLEQNPLYRTLTPDVRTVARQSLAQSAAALKEIIGALSWQAADSLSVSDDLLTRAERDLARIAERLSDLAEIETDLLELGRLARRARRLAEATSDLQTQRAQAESSSATSNDRASELDAQQGELSEQQQELSEDLEDLLDRRPEIVDAARMELLERLAKLAGQALDLAELEDHLADSIAEEWKSRPEAVTRAQALKNGENGEADAVVPASSNTEETGLTNTQFDTALNEVRSLSTATAQLALDIAVQSAPDSPHARVATELAQRTADSSVELLTGRLSRSASSTSRSRILANRLSAEQELPPDVQPKIAQLSQRIDKLNDSLTAMANEFAARQSGFRLGQRNLAGATFDLEQQFADIALRLAKEPIDLPYQALLVETIRATTHSAVDSMNLVDRSVAGVDYNEATQAGHLAAKSLRDAAELVSEVAGTREQYDSPVPPEVGSQVTEAAQQLAEAQQRLSEANSNQTGESSSTEGQQSAQSGESNSESGQSSADSLAQSADSMQQAADSLSQAANQIQSGLGNAAESSDAQSSESSSGTGSPEGDNSGSSGTGAGVTDQIQRLEIELARMQSREWGQLHGQLRTEILQSSQRPATGVYAELIKHYFRQIADGPADSPTPQQTNP